MEKHVIIEQTHIEVYPYQLGDEPSLEKMLSKKVYYNNRYYTYVPFTFHIEDDVLYLPRGISPGMVAKRFNTQPTNGWGSDPYMKIPQYEVTAPPKNDIQEEAIRFLLCEGEFSNNQNFTQFSLNLDQGDGKTYSCVNALLQYSIKAIIITHQEKIKEQWYNTFHTMTDVPDDAICNIAGTEVLHSIMDMKESPKYHFYLVNHQTLAGYGRRYGWNKVREFFQKIKVGIKVIDEAHLFFENTLMIDYFSNTYKTFYLTATFNRSDHQEVYQFKRAFQSVVRFGEETFNYEEKRKQVVFVVVFFQSIPLLGTPPKVRTAHGFSSYKYIDYELSDESGRVLDQVVKKIITQSERLEGKRLILSPKTDSAEHFKQLIADNFDYSVGTIHSKNDPSVNQETLQKDFVSSTSKSFGTGADLKGLRILINTEPIGGSLLADQVRGRLREYSKDKDTFLFYPVDTIFQDTSRMLKQILPVMKKKCKEIIMMHM